MGIFKTAQDETTNPISVYCKISDSDDEGDYNWARADLSGRSFSGANMDSIDRRNIVIFTQEQWEKVLNNIKQLESQVAEYEIATRSMGS
jgi:hypothetical protein